MAAASENKDKRQAKFAQKNLSSEKKASKTASTQKETSTKNSASAENPVSLQTSQKSGNARPQGKARQKTAPAPVHLSVFAIVESGGKQYKLRPGEFVRVGKLPLEKGAKWQSPALAFQDPKGKFYIGTPVLQKVEVTGEISRHGRFKKELVFKNAAATGTVKPRATGRILQKSIFKQ